MELIDRITIATKRKSATLDIPEHFIHTLINYRLSLIASNMRAQIKLFDGGIIPINSYSTILSGSGNGKGKISSLLNKIIVNKFIPNFLTLYKQNQFNSLQYRAEENALVNGTSELFELKKLQKTVESLPSISSHLQFADCTQRGILVQRRNLHLSGLGAFSLHIDEIGYNIGKLSEVISDMLISYDLGQMNIKALGSEQIEDSAVIPTNLLMMGTPSALLAGGEKEALFLDMLASGLSRRSHFCYIPTHKSTPDEYFSPQEIIDSARSEQIDSSIIELSEYFGTFASDDNLDIIITIPDPISIQILEYEHSCKLKASALSEYQELEKLNLIHSYWTLTKLLGALAYADKSDIVTQEHYDYALQYTITSCEHFQTLIKRPSKPQMLADFIVGFHRPLTLFDLADSLPFFKSAKKQDKQEMLDLAISYAANPEHNIFIQFKIKDNVEYYSGSILNETTLDDIILSVNFGATSMTNNFEPLTGLWEDLWQIPTSLCNYSAHHFVDNYRTGKNALLPFNLIILDVDDGLSIEAARIVLEDNKYLIVPTKSHQIEKNGKVCDRYRIFLPLKYTLELSIDDYSTFMKNIMTDFPIEVDPACSDIARAFFGFPNQETS